MTPERWAKVRDIFEGAVERPAKDRAAYLRVVCARDDELRREVESLIASHDEATDFLSKPAAQLSQVIVPREEDTNEYQPGYRLGPYEFVKRIGTGGMGSVWLATRFDSEYKKRVAIKMVRRGMNTQEILRRFRMERQVLANLEHPNIAGLIDGGSTPDGLPYLVMEYVEGIPIDKYCEDHKSSITDRLKLFRAVCSAVQYAHQNLVIHRDIKAGNILVTADGTAKLLDFGIAKLMHSPSSTLDLSQTRPDMRPMTLDYASPEQVRGDQITTATDIYSLGVLLYKLLTGKMPYGVDGRSRAALEHAICEIEPARPSTVVLGDDKIAIPDATQRMEVALAETRDVARRRLRKKISGDLDNIILMALRKEPHRRYTSAGQFSADVGRFLENRPVMARLDTPGYRIAKFVRRNLQGVIAAAALVIALLIFSGVSMHRANVAERSRRDVLRRANEEKHELIRTTEALGEAQLSSGDGAAAYASFNRARQTAGELEKSEGAQATPDTMRSIAEIDARLGKMLLESGVTDSALARLNEARDCYRKLLKLDPGNQEWESAAEDVEKTIAAVTRPR